MSKTSKYTLVSSPAYGGGNEAIDEHISAVYRPVIVTPIDTPSSEAQPYLEVVAPATLPEGYTFDAEANGHSFTVKVPMGGVEEGQKFSVPFPAGSNGCSESAIPRTSVPVGHWKDGLCDCFRLGVIHPVVWTAYCCPMILTGQVLHRLKLTWLGNEGTMAQITTTFRILLLITISSLMIRTAILFLVFPYLTSGMSEDGMSMSEEPADGVDVVLLERDRIMAFGYMVFMVFIVAKTRNKIRLKYSIPGQSCQGCCEDCCCAFWCTCCTVSQMARHTADYETYAGVCCSETGLPPHATSIV